MGLDLEGVVSRFFFWSNGAKKPQRLTENQSVAVAEVEPRNLEFSRAGQRFLGGCQVIANGISPVQAIPTTSPTIALYNPDPIKSYALDWITFYLLSGTQPVGCSLWGGVSSAKIPTVPANTSNWGNGSASGSTKTRSAALWAASVTMPTVPVATAYVPLSLQLGAASTTAGQGGSGTDLSGSIIIPPNYALGMFVLGGAGTSAIFGISASWSEIQLDLE